jgi:hypothetical protein
VKEYSSLVFAEKLAEAVRLLTVFGRCLAYWLGMFVIFLNPSRYLPAQYLSWGMAASFHIPFLSLVTR